jgi:ATP-binding cassette subfamily F protein uup
VLAPEGDGRWREYVGGYADWVRQRPAAAAAGAAARASADERRRGQESSSAGDESARNTAKPTPGRVKLSYKESRELEQLPARIEALEAEQKALTAAMGEAEYHKRGAEQMRRDAVRAQEIERELETAFERWAELDARK